MGRGQEAGLSLSSLHVSFFLGSWSDGWAAANELGLRWAPFMFPFWAPGPRPKAVGLSSCFLLSGSWVGWVGRGKEAGFWLGSLHISFLGSCGGMGKPRPRSWGSRLPGVAKPLSAWGRRQPRSVERLPVQQLRERREWPVC